MNDELPVKDAITYRLLFADVIRATAILMVILLHTSALYFYQEGTPRSWHFTNLINSFTRPAVPLFLMLSGALLLSPDKKELPSKFLAHQFGKILPSLLFWSAFYYLFQIYLAGTPFIIAAFLNGLVKGNLYYHLPFLYYLLGLYFAYPLLRAFFRGANKVECAYFLTVWIVTIIVAGISDFFGFGVSKNLLIFFGFIGYPVAGWLIHSFDGKQRFMKIAVVIFLLGWLATATLTWYQKATGAYAEFFYEYLSPNVVFTSIAMFYLFRFMNWNMVLGRITKITATLISLLSFDIYFIHPFFLFELMTFLPQFLLRKSYIGILLLFILTTVASVFVAFLISRIKKIIREIKFLILSQDNPQKG